MTPEVIAILNNWLIKPTFILMLSHYTNVPTHFKSNVNFYKEEAFGEQRLTMERGKRIIKQ